MCKKYNNIWLADLTYTQQTISSDTVPAAIAMIAEYACDKLNFYPNIKLFKFPERLISNLDKCTPDIFACSNYVWNYSLSSLFCKRIKERNANVITIMGGVNFPTVNAEMEEFVRKHHWIDFFIIKEGEESFLRLINYLNGESSSLLNTIFLDKKTDKVVFPENIERVLNLEDIPSPYLSGRLDEFLDGRLMPVIQTNRGCPFSCTFCTEGQNFWNKVKRKKPELVAKEIRYISEIMTNIVNDNVRSDLLIADSNFGMFKDDIEVCKIIANEQEKFGYPTYINVATGKNRKERVLEAAKLVNGAMKLAGSVQSLDEDVLKNIKRNNISGEQIIDLALDASKIGANTYSEVILALPGDSLEKHFDTLKQLVEASFNTISTYQLMILPGTELGLDSTKRKYNMVSKYRVQPRCFGIFDIFGESSAIAEIEEICVANNTLSYKDYLNCRKMNFIVNLFYNDGIFSALRKLLAILNISCWDWLYDIYNNSYSEIFDNLINNFLLETENELFDSRSELEEYVSRQEVVEKFISGDEANNILFRFKSISITSMFPVLCEVAQESINNIIYKNNIVYTESVFDLIRDIILYKKAQIQDIFSGKKHVECMLHYDVSYFCDSTVIKSVNELRSLKLTNPKIIRFKHTSKQVKLISTYIGLFGSDVKGVSRILGRVFLKQLFRNPVHTSEN